MHRHHKRSYHSRTEHRRAENPKSFTDQYRAFRLVYDEEFADVRAAIAREKQIKGSTRAKKNALVASMNPQWRDLVLEWEKKYGLVFQLDGRIVKAEGERQQQHQHQPQVLRPRAGLRMTRLSLRAV